jgi:hypothetical protein
MKTRTPRVSQRVVRALDPHYQRTAVRVARVMFVLAIVTALTIYVLDPHGWIKFGLYALLTMFFYSQGVAGGRGVGYFDRGIAEHATRSAQAVRERDR